jgi:hypothetical protein
MDWVVFGVVFVVVFFMVFPVVGVVVLGVVVGCVKYLFACLGKVFGLGRRKRVVLGGSDFFGLDD